MRRKSNLIAIVALLGMAFGQQAIADTATIDVEISPGVKRVSNLATASQTLSIDGIDKSSFPDETVLLQGLTGLVYVFGVSADSANGLGTGSIFGTQINVSNNGTALVRVRVELSAMGDASGRNAFSTNQIGINCTSGCTHVTSSLELIPEYYRDFYNRSLAAGDKPQNTVPPRETFVINSDVPAGPSISSGQTGKTDLRDQPDVQISFLLDLLPLGTVILPLDSSATAIQSTAMATGRLSIAVAAIPEPEAFAMMLAGLGLVGFAVRRRMRSS